MKATLAFDLPEDQADFDSALLGRKALLALWEIDQHCRGILKHGEPTPEQRELASEIREMIPPGLLDV